MNTKVSGRITIRKCSGGTFCKVAPELNIAREKNKSYENSGTWYEISLGRIPERCYIAKRNGEVIGWGCSWGYNKENHIYVLPKYRRKGIGTRILKVLEKHKPDFKFCPWDYRSQTFFKGRAKNITYTYCRPYECSL